ncbi:MAG TPA: helix-turn-helix domain-containing protein [Solirubrobacteraceae bacterium]|jgi:DNA-binding HxlR family transcriptional regulator
MKRTALIDHPCSIARTLDVAGEWWTPLILRDVAYGVRRFAAIEEDLGISANVLADRLQTLVAEGILQRSVYQQRPERHEYRLTDKGADLIPALLALMQWGDRWAWSGGRGPVRVVHDECGHDVRVEVRCPHCEREAATAELRARPRGGIVEPPGEHEPGAVSGRRLLASAEGVLLDARRDGADASR